MVSARARDFLLREKVRVTKLAGGDVRAVCLDPRWLLPSAATRPIGEVVADLRAADDPVLTRMARAFEQSAHLTGAAASRPQRVDTILGWMRAEPRLHPVVDRCIPLLRRAYAQVRWVVRPTGSGRAHTLSRHRAHVAGVRFSTDDRSLITVDQDGQVLLWDVESGAPVGPLDPAQAWAERGDGDAPQGSRPAIRIQYGREQTRILTGGDNQVAVLTPQGLLAVWSLEDDPRPRYAVATGGDGGYSATFPVALDDQSFLTRADDCFRVHEWRTGKVLLILPLDGQSANSALSGDKRYFAVESDEGVVDVWDLQRRSMVGRVSLGRIGLSALAIDGYWLFTIDDNDVGRTWWWPDVRVHATYSGVFDAVRVEAGADRLSFLPNPGELAVVGLSGRGAYPVRAFLPDADDYGRATTVDLSPRWLATVHTRTRESGVESLTIEHRVTVFDRASGHRVADGWGEGEAVLAAPAPDEGQLLLVSGGGEVEIWDPAAERVRRTRTGTGGSGGTVAAVSHDRRTVAVSHGNDVQLVRPQEDQELGAYAFSGTPVSAVADPGGRWFATVTDQLVLYVCDPVNGQVRHRCAGPADLEFRNALHFPAWSPDGRWIAVDDWDSRVLVWDPVTGRQLPGFGPLDARTVFVASRPAGPLVLRRHDDQHLSLWQFGTRRPLAELPPAVQVVGDVSGQWIAMRDHDDAVFLLTVGERRLVNLAHGVRGIAGGPRLILWTDHEVRAMTVPDGRVETLTSSSTPIAEVLCDAAGRRPLVIGVDGSLATVTGSVLSARVTLPGELSLSPDGRTLAATHSGTVRLVDVTDRGGQVAITLDGTVRGTAWLGGDSLVAAGAFGLQSLAIGRPTPLEET